MSSAGFVVNASTHAERVEEILKWQGDNWFVALAALNVRLSRIDPDYTLIQIKEKFGELRFYYDTKPRFRRSMDKIVDDTVRDCWQADQNRKVYNQIPVPPEIKF